MDLSSLTNTTTISPPGPDHTVPTYVGYIGILVSVLFLGSNYLPIKKYPTGDGMFFQLLLTTGIWIVGFVVNWSRNFPKFYPLPMLGGFLWTTGNLNTVPVMNTIGIGLGSLFPNVILLCLGWAIARFGFFGIKPEVPSNPTFNYIGVVLTLISGVFFVFVKPNTAEKRDELTDELITNQHTAEVSQIYAETTASDENSGEQVYFGSLNTNLKRIIGIGLACFSGCLYAFTFTPGMPLNFSISQSKLNITRLLAGMLNKCK